MFLGLNLVGLYCSILATTSGGVGIGGAVGGVTIFSSGVMYCAMPTPSIVSDSDKLFVRECDYYRFKLCLRHGRLFEREYAAEIVCALCLSGSAEPTVQYDFESVACVVSVDCDESDVVSDDYWWSELFWSGEGDFPVDSVLFPPVNIPVHVGSACA